MAVAREKGREDPEGWGCWCRRWRLPGPGCLGGWGGSPSGERVDG